MAELDLIGRKIIAELMHDATTPIAQIADRVGLSQTPCRKRIQKLETAGVLTRHLAFRDGADEIHNGLPRQRPQPLITPPRALTNPRRDGTTKLYSVNGIPVPAIVPCPCGGGSGDLAGRKGQPEWREKQPGPRMRPNPRHSTAGRI